MKRCVSILAAAVMLLCFPYAARAYSARSMVLIEQSTGTVLVDVDSSKRMPMASTTKIMTALVTLENADLTEPVVIPAQAAGIEGSSMYLAAGETLTVSDLLYGLMLTSGNDAATALALHVGGDEQRFVDMMNERAQSLGLTDTNFKNPSGLPDDEHYTTAAELAKITAAALANETFASIVSTDTARVPYKNNPDGRTLKNHNKLLHLYDDAIGVKTGFTKKAGRCLVGAARRDGVTLICVTLNDGDDWNDHIAAFDYGFSVAKTLPLAGAGEVCVTLSTPDGATVTAHNANTLETVVFGDVSVSSVIKAEPFVYSPKSAGDKVGQVLFYVDGKLAATDELLLESDLLPPPPKKELLITRIIKRIKGFFIHE